MNDDTDKISEDLYTGTEFDDEDENGEAELKNAQFVDSEPAEIKIKQTNKEKISQFYGEDKKLLAEKIIEKKSGKIIEIKYDELGNKKLVNERDKDKRLLKSTDYYANGGIKMITDYLKNGAYRSMMYNADGSWVSLVDKHEDGTADATYFDVDKTGANLIVKMDANKEVIEKRLDRK